MAGTLENEEKGWRQRGKEEEARTKRIFRFSSSKLGFSYSTKKVSRIMTTLKRMGPMRSLRSDPAATSAIW
ncbi:hypothetical protein Taro_053700 [Colocasia esculenta]|uniref:Uncharacterized protein n=1 Tax=Colocasia esculenta TaxID=4460 RepID=A0A843XMY1_COLES|nr:hypothetical protein [Colocasia esculenta]